MTNSDTFNLEDRILCSDDACIGIIGDDGLCGECGHRAGDGGTPVSPPEPIESNPTVDPFSDEEESEERVPCPDGTCVGILHTDGVCGTCGNVRTR